MFVYMYACVYVRECVCALLIQTQHIIYSSKCDVCQMS